MVSAGVLAFWVVVSVADPRLSPSSIPIEMILAAKTDKDGRWCAEPVFDATIRNVSLAPAWLETGRRDEPTGEQGLVLRRQGRCVEVQRRRTP